jgi:bacteriocin-like protein
MSDVIDKILDWKHFMAIELTDQELETVNGGEFFGGGFFPFFPFAFGSSFAITSLAFGGGFGGFW